MTIEMGQKGAMWLKNASIRSLEAARDTICWLHLLHRHLPFNNYQLCKESCANDNVPRNVIAIDGPLRVQCHQA